MTADEYRTAIETLGLSQIEASRSAWCGRTHLSPMGIWRAGGAAARNAFLAILNRH
jgi:hypothetical protein